MRALVVGGSGYLGRATLRALAERGIDVVSLSRSGGAVVGDGLCGDVREHDLGLDAPCVEDLRASITHLVSCFGSVDWQAGPRSAIDLHQRGTVGVLRFAQSCRRLERLVHVSSVLALGRTGATVTDELELGQSFRNWYEYGKYLAEREVRANERLRWRIVRLGPVLGPGPDPIPPSGAHGLLASVPFLVRGYPIHLSEHGRFPCYVAELATAADVIARAALDDGPNDIWTWMDDAMPTLAAVLVGLCGAWGVMPRIVEMPLLRPLWRAAAGKLGAPAQLLDYADSWPAIAPEALLGLPADLPHCPAGYVEATGEALRRSSVAAELV